MSWRGGRVEWDLSASGTMQKTAWLISFPHTGTHFLRWFLTGLPGFDYTLKQKHYDPDTLEAYRKSSTPIRPVMPMRDPLRVMISECVRGSRFATEMWCHGAGHLSGIDPIVVPLDLIAPENRRERMAAAAGAIGINGSATSGYCQAWATIWDQVAASANASKAHQLKSAYASGEAETIRSIIPEKFDELQQAEPVLRPWLESIGYRNLLWWS